MGWLFSTRWQSKEAVMKSCTELTQEGIEKGWTLLHAKLCRGGFALAYKNTKTGELSISYHITEYDKAYGGYGEKCVDPFIAWEVLPEKTVSEYMEKHGDKVYCDGKTYRQYFEEIKKEKERKKQCAKTKLVQGKWYCINRFGYSSMPLGVGRFDGIRGRSLIFGGYRMVRLSKTDIVEGGFNTQAEAELWIVQNVLANLSGSYVFDKAVEYINKTIECTKLSVEISTTPEYIEKQKKALAHFSNLLAILQRSAA